MAGTLLFAGSALLSVLGALSIVLARDSLSGVRGLALSLVGMGGVFVNLDAGRLALFHLFVLGGALLLLLVSTVMLSGIGEGRKNGAFANAKISRVISAVLVTMAGMGALSIFSSADLVGITQNSLLLATIVFSLGTIGFLVRRNIVLQLLSLVVMLSSVNLLFVAFDRQPGAHSSAQAFVFVVIVLIALEVVVALAIIQRFYRLRLSVSSDEAAMLRH